MRRTAPVGASVVLALVLMAGCVRAGQSNSDPSFNGVDDDLATLRGRVLDLEIMPVESVDVAVAGTDVITATDAEGLFVVSNLQPGEYVLSASKRGYAPATAHVALTAGEITAVTLSMAAVASDVPYHESQLFVALLDCSWAAAGATFPCVPLDRVTGQTITGDQSAWRFLIPASGLADLLHEMVWTSQATGREMKVVITEPNQPVFVGGVSRFFLVNQGPAPIRAWLTPGIVAVGGSVPFDGNESVVYSAYIRGSERNNTIPAALYIDQKAHNWFTFFYNRPGPSDYTALPDS